MLKRCTVACDTARGVLRCELELPDDATVATALRAAQPLLDAQLTAAAGDTAVPADAVDWQDGPVGIFGRICSREQLLADGDRVELYRALPSDPRTQRRVRATGRKARGRR